MKNKVVKAYMITMIVMGVIIGNIVACLYINYKTASQKLVVEKIDEKNSQDYKSNNDGAGEQKETDDEEKKNKKVADFSEDRIVDVYATSFLSENVDHSAYNIVDGALDTAWVEGVQGTGEGEGITIKFDDEYTIRGMKIWNGYYKSKGLFYKNGKITKLVVQFSNGQEIMVDLSCDFDEDGYMIEFPCETITSSIKLYIANSQKGSKYEDTCISEVEIY